MIKPNELRNMTAGEIKLKEESLRKELYQLRSDAQAGRIEKPHKIRDLRRDIAKCETILSEKSHAK